MYLCPWTARVSGWGKFPWDEKKSFFINLALSVVFQGPGTAPTCTCVCALALSPGRSQFFQCCTLKNGRAWEAKSRACDCAITVVYLCIVQFYTLQCKEVIAQLHTRDFASQALPFFRVQHWKNWERPGDEAIIMWVALFAGLTYNYLLPELAVVWFLPCLGLAMLVLVLSVSMFSVCWITWEFVVMQPSVLH